MSFLSALSFLTIIPVTPRHQASPEEIGRSIAYFPVVGIIIGLILAGLNWLLGLFLPLAIVNGLLIVSMVVISGALHLDGFVDTCDGIAGHKTVEDRWAVMHDSRAGAFGITGAFLLLLVKYAALSSVPENLMMTTLVLVPVVSRWTMVYAVFVYPYARLDGLGKSFKQGASWQGFVVATVITMAGAMVMARLADAAYFYLTGLAIMFVIWVVVVTVASYMKQKFSGLTGDTYGAINEVAEAGVLILVCLLAYNQWLWLG
ncbi:adenosylcobinamide-GDP ribazoletransferase [Chloroflexota bacterium]